jgi:hypothetical protein
MWSRLLFALALASTATALRVPTLRVALTTSVARPLFSRTGAIVAIVDAVDHTLLNEATTNLYALFPWEVSYDSVRTVSKARSTFDGHENDLLFQGFLLFVFPVAVTAFFLTNRPMD